MLQVLSGDEHPPDSKGAISLFYQIYLNSVSPDIPPGAVEWFGPHIMDTLKRRTQRYQPIPADAFSAGLCRSG